MGEKALMRGEGGLPLRFLFRKNHLPFAVPGVRLADGAAALHTDRGTLCAFAVSATGSAQARAPPGEGIGGDSPARLPHQ